MLPPSRHFTRRPRLDLGYHLAAWRNHLANPSLRWLFLVGFLAMGVFVTVYNYAGFRLQAPPYDLSQGHASAIFVVYLFGMAASWTAGAMADRLGRGPVLMVGAIITMAGLALTIAAPLPAMVSGIVVLTIGFSRPHGFLRSHARRRIAGGHPATARHRASSAAPHLTATCIC